MKVKRRTGRAGIDESWVVGAALAVLYVAMVAFIGWGLIQLGCAAKDRFFPGPNETYIRRVFDGKDRQGIPYYDEEKRQALEWARTQDRLEVEYASGQSPMAPVPTAPGGLENRPVEKACQDITGPTGP